MRCLLVSLLWILACNEDVDLRSTDVERANLDARTEGVTDQLKRQTQYRLERFSETCQPTIDSVMKEFWEPYIMVSCLECHNSNGQASNTSLVLRPSLNDGVELPNPFFMSDEDLVFNLTALQSYLGVNAETVNTDSLSKSIIAEVESVGEVSRLLAKASGLVDHQGWTVIDPNAEGFAILEQKVRNWQVDDECLEVTGSSMDALPESLPSSGSEEG